MTTNLFCQYQAQARLTNAQCARVLDVDISTIGRYRSGSKVPRAVLLVLEHYDFFREQYCVV